MPPERQLILIDACRTPDRVANLLAGLPTVGRSIIDPIDHANRGGTPATQSVHFATSAYTPAWGRPDKVSLYSEALLQALSGGGAQGHHGWWVSSGGLQDALSAYTLRLARKAGVEQKPDRTRSGSFAIHKPQKLNVPVYVTCDPTDVWASPFYLAVERGGRVADRHDHDPKSSEKSEWSLTLPKDVYDFKAVFGVNGRHVDATATEMVVPPEMPICLTIDRREL